LSFSFRFLIQRGWLDPEPSWKFQKRNFTSTRVIFFVIVLSFLSFSHPDQASGEGGKPGLGNAKKCKKMTPGLGNAKKMPKKNDSQSGKCKTNAKKTQRKCKEHANKKDSRAGKVAFLEFPGRPRFPALSRPPRAISPRPRPPNPVFEPPPPKPAPEPGDNSSSRQAQKRIPQGKLPCPILLHRRLPFQEFLHLFLVFGAATR